MARLRGWFRRLGFGRGGAIASPVPFRQVLATVLADVDHLSLRVGTLERMLREEEGERRD